MPNPFNYSCPKCGSRDEIEICALVSLRLIGNGATMAEDVIDIDGHCWSSENAAACNACGFDGTVKDFEPAGAAVIQLFGTRQASRR